MSPYVIRYHPDPPNMKPDYFYDDEYEYYSDHIKPRRRLHRRRKGRGGYHHPHYHHHNHHNSNNNNSNNNNSNNRGNYHPRHSYPRHHQHHHNNNHNNHNNNHHNHHGPYRYHQHPNHYYHDDNNSGSESSDDDDYYHHNYHHNHHRKHEHDHRIHYLSPRSLPPLTYVSEEMHDRRRAPFKLELLKPRTTGDLNGPARIALEDRRPRWDRESDICHDTCPQKSSKAIPSMHYDELRCPHCAARVQPSQDEVITYPWTVQSYRPKYKQSSSEPGLDVTSGPRTAISEGLEPLAVSDFSRFGVARPHQPTNRNGLEVANSIITQRSNAQIPPKPDVNPSGPVVDPEKPTRRPSEILGTRPPPKAASVATDGGREGAVLKDSVANQSRALFGTGDRAIGARGTYVIKEPRLPPQRAPDPSEVDVGPYDSISNVRFPAVRAESLVPVAATHGKRTMSEVDKSYPREKYFQSMRVTHPGHAPSTPRPLREREDRDRDNRVFKGEYIDRRDGQRYQYNVNMGKKSVYSERRPFG